MKKEIAYIQDLIRSYPRTSAQMNSPFHSDAEILKVNNGYVGVSVDAVSEEIDLKILLSPQTLGWLTVTASVSDLAAVGMKTDRISLLLKENGRDKSWCEQFDQGVEEAISVYNIHSAEKLMASGSQTLSACTAYGFSLEKPVLSRLGLKPGDTLFCTGPIGWGNAVAFANLAIRPMNATVADKLDMSYRPRAKVQEALFLNNHAHVCIDTSDGLLSTLKWLEIFNHSKIDIQYKESLFHPVASEVARMAQVTPWLFMAAQNGEFELIFAVAENKLKTFQQEAQSHGYRFLEIATVKEGKGISLNGRDLQLDQILDMLHEGVGPEEYIRRMLAFAIENQIRFQE